MAEDPNGWSPEQLATLAADLLAQVRTQIESKTSALIASGFTFTFNSVQYTFDTGPDSLSKLAIAYSVAKQYQAAGQSYGQPMVMRDYQVIMMDRDSIITNYEAMIAYGLQIYGQHAALIQQANAMDYYALLAWKDPRA
jgi:hypothetical protein